MGGIEFYLIGHQIAFINDDLGKVNESDRGQSRNVEMKDDAGTVQATMTKAIDKDTGAVSVDLTTSVNMPVFGLNANSKVKLTGEQCPNPEGKVDLTVEYSTNGRAGSSGSMIYDKTLTAKIKATVNNSAEIGNLDIDLKQATRSTAGGRQVYVETSQTGRATSGKSSDLHFNDVRIDRASSQATAADADLSRDGLSAAYNVARAVLDNAQSRWQEGGCVQIEATSPGSVAVNSITQIPVKVTHRVDRSEVPSKLEAKLTGGATIDPTVIPKTSGTLTYTAPGEAGKSATIMLTANSRRGRATLDLTASTGSNSYRVNGTSSGVSINGEICSLGKPFFFNAKFPGGTGKIQFNPASAAGGALTESGGGSGCTYTGSGDYSFSLKDDGSGTITWTTTAKLSCPMGFSNSRTVTFSLPLIPAPDLACP
jgi:TusA-related sulfurtransferase